MARSLLADELWFLLFFFLFKFLLTVEDRLRLYYLWVPPHPEIGFHHLVFVTDCSQPSVKKKRAVSLNTSIVSD